MTTPVLICDDSSFARKQMARALPRDWDVEVSFAGNGEECLEALRAGKGDILFLDLNMPVLDGYGVLEAIRREDLNTLVIVVSGDVQQEARERVIRLGAMDFVKKPIDSDTIGEILDRFGIRGEPGGDLGEFDFEVNIHDCYQEIANVAMGQAGELLARLLGSFIELPVPKVRMIDGQDLKMTLEALGDGDSGTAICQGFIGAGIAGEAFLSFGDSRREDVARLVGADGTIDENTETELLMDVAGILVGACLKGMGEQLDISFSQGHPILIGRHIHIAELVKHNAGRWGPTLAIDIPYSIEGHQVHCDLLLLFTGESLSALNERVSYLS